MIVKLNEYGMSWAECLERVPALAIMVDDPFIPVNPENGWNLANEVVRLLRKGVESATNTTGDVALKLREYIEIPQAVMEEILLELSDTGFVEVAPVSLQQQAAWAVNMFRVLAHHRRARIILTISESDVATSKDLCEALGDVPVMTMRYHLDPLVKHGIVEAVNRDGHIEYTLVLPLLKAIGRRFNRCFC